MTGNSIIVKGFGDNIDQNDIRKTFSFCGKIVDTRIIEIENSRRCIVSFDSPSAVSIALLLTNGKLKDSIIEVEEYHGEYENLNNNLKEIESKEQDKESYSNIIDSDNEFKKPSYRCGKPDFNQIAFIQNLCPTVSSKSFVKYFSICGQIEAYKIDRETQTALIQFQTSNSVEVAKMCSGTVLGKQDIQIENYNPKVHGDKLYNFLFTVPNDSISYEESKEEYLRHFEETIIKVPLTRIQKRYYMDIILEHMEDDLNVNALFEKLLSCCKHPFSIPQQSFLQNVEPSKRREKIVKWSGKYQYLDEILPTLYKNNKHVLVCISDEKNLEIFNQYISTYNYTVSSILESKNNSSFIYSYKGESIVNIDIPQVDIVICLDPEWNIFNNSLIKQIRNSSNTEITFYRILSEYTLEECLFKLMSSYLDQEKFIWNLSLKNKDMILRYSVYTFFLCDMQASDNKNETYKKILVSYEQNNMNFQPTELPHGKLDIEERDFWKKFNDEIKLLLNKGEKIQSEKIECRRIIQETIDDSSFINDSKGLMNFDDLVPTDDYIVTIEKIVPDHSY